MKRNAFYLMLILALSVMVYVPGCSSSGDDDDDDDQDDDTELDISICAPENGPFTLDIDNEFFPLTVGAQLVLEGEDEGAALRLQITVLDETEDVAGVTTRVVEEREWEDDVLLEVSRNFYVQAPEGTLCYYGEDVDIYEDGEIASHEGAWRADGASNLPGIMMPGDPQVGQTFYQEYAPGIAEDKSRIVAFGETITVPAGTFDDTLHAVDWNPLEGGDEQDTKYYVRGIGIAIDEDAELTGY